MEYEIDSANVICSVSRDWDDFIDENGGASAIRRAQIVGRSLRDFVVGESTWMMYDVLLRRVRLLRTPVRRHFRCDGPLVRRDFTMTLEPSASGSVTFKTELVDSVPRVRPVNFSYRSDAEHVRCSVCGRVTFDSLGFQNPDEVLDRLGWVGVSVSYGVCERCEAQMSA